MEIVKNFLETKEGQALLAHFSNKRLSFERTYDKDRNLETLLAKINSKIGVNMLKWREEQVYTVFSEFSDISNYSIEVKKCFYVSGYQFNAVNIKNKEEN